MQRRSRRRTRRRRRNLQRSPSLNSQRLVGALNRHTFQAPDGSRTGYPVFGEFKHENGKFDHFCTTDDTREPIYQELTRRGGGIAALQKPKNECFFTVYLKNRDAARRLLEAGTILVERVKQGERLITLQVNLHPYDPKPDRLQEMSINRHDCGFDFQRSKDRQRTEDNKAIERWLKDVFKFYLPGEGRREVWTYDHPGHPIHELIKNSINVHYWQRFSHWGHYHRILLTFIFLKIRYLSIGWDVYYRYIDNFLDRLPAGTRSNTPQHIEEEYLWMTLVSYGVDRHQFNKEWFDQTIGHPNHHPNYHV